MSAGSVPSHGNSPAAWTTVIVGIVAFAIGTFGFCFANAPVVYASVGLLIVGAIVGLIMKAMGYGVGGDRLSSKSH